MSQQGYTGGRRSPAVLTAIVGGHAALLAALMLIKMEMPIPFKPDPIFVKHIPLVKPPEVPPPPADPAPALPRPSYSATRSRTPIRPWPPERFSAPPPSSSTLTSISVGA